MKKHSKLAILAISISLVISSGCALLPRHEVFILPDNLMEAGITELSGLGG